MEAIKYCVPGTPTATKHPMKSSGAMLVVHLQFEFTFKFTRNSMNKIVKAVVGWGKPATPNNTVAMIMLGFLRHPNLRAAALTGIAALITFGAYNANNAHAESVNSSAGLITHTGGNQGRTADGKSVTFYGKTRAQTSDGQIISIYKSDFNDEFTPKKPLQPNNQTHNTPPNTPTNPNTSSSAVDIDLVPVKGGCFKMGDTFGDGQANEKPVHEVCVSDFRIGRYEVTQAQWQAVMGSNPSKNQQGGAYPVEMVSWDDIQEFIGRLNRATGRNYRLPTEAEWEYACRSGGKKEKYCGGKEPDGLAWYGDNSGGSSHLVGQKQPNTIGIYDMSGNVWEWCQDWYGFYGEERLSNPTGPQNGSKRVCRGGGWLNRNDGATRTRAARRAGDSPDSRSDNVGFRLALTAR